MTVSYIQYNNTVVPGNVTTIYNHNATKGLYTFFFEGDYTLPGVPTALVNSGAFIYGGTSMVRGTEVVVDNALTVSVCLLK